MRRKKNVCMVLKIYITLHIVKSIKCFSNVSKALCPCKVKNQLKYKRQ